MEQQTEIDSFLRLLLLLFLQTISEGCWSVGWLAGNNEESKNEFLSCYSWCFHILFGGEVEKIEFSRMANDRESCWKMSQEIQNEENDT